MAGSDGSGLGAGSAGGALASSIWANGVSVSRALPEDWLRWTWRLEKALVSDATLGT
jgi:hypothetical protein